MVRIAIDINKCTECPFVKCTKHYTEDSWEHASDYWCGRADNRKIAVYIEWPREMPLVPDWCPIKI